jgi:hypothetical protein
MTEAQLTRKFLTRWRERYPAAVCMKINDRSTGGLPDAVITMCGRSLWIEFKRDKPKLTAIQEETTRRLCLASEQRSVVVVFNRVTTHVEVWQPHHGPAGAALRLVNNDRTTDEAITYLVGRAFL